MFKSLNPTIAIIDSGIGGVSILKQLISKFNGGNYIYFADNLHMPYGNKNKAWLTKRVKTLIRCLQVKYNADYVIVGCNTASTVVKAQEFKNVKTMEFRSGYVYFATKLTQKNIKNLNVIADYSLAQQIEKFILNEKKLQMLVKRHIKQHNLMCETEFVLGCTHYELVKALFEKYCPKSTVISNSSFIVNSIDLNIKSEETNVVTILSKKDDDLNNKILKILRS
ncbi:MAG: hypothetical protein IJW36_02785 [Clostridia bacterium]|nr:hypothetical protein [Clostridia bacterium]